MNYLAYTGAGAAVNVTTQHFYTAGYPVVLVWCLIAVVIAWLVYELYNDTH